MRKGIIIIIFISGLGIFSYPIIADMFSTKAHQTVIRDYDATVSAIDEVEKADVIKKANEHNDRLNDEPMEFIDPFENGTENSGNNSYYSALDIGPAMGTLEIPSIGVNLPIYHGSSDGVLSKGVGHLENSSLPMGSGGTHSVLTAHRGLLSSKLFRNINDVEVGHEFRIRVLDEIMTYEVFNIDIVLPNETDWLQMEEGRSLVTLLSCEPYMINTHRLLVTGELISTEKASESAFIGKTHDLGQGDNYLNYIIMAISLIFIIIIIYLLITGRNARDDQ